MMVAMLLLVAACGTDGSAGVVDPPAPDGEPALPEPSPEPTPTPTPPPTSGLAMSWTEPFELTLPNGWVVGGCGHGDRTHVCVVDGGELLGDIELLAGYPFEPDQMTQEPGALLAALAADVTSHFREDRAQGCAGFPFAADDVTVVTVGGQPATRTAFTLTDGEGQVVERVMNYGPLAQLIGPFCRVRTCRCR
jgi:hypothetical protein